MSSSMLSFSLLVGSVELKLSSEISSLTRTSLEEVFDTLNRSVSDFCVLRACGEESLFSTLSHVLDSIFGPWPELADVSGVFSGEKGGEEEVLGPCWYLRMIVYERFLLVMNNRGTL